MVTSRTPQTFITTSTVATIDQYSDQGKRHQYFFFFHAPMRHKRTFIVRKKARAVHSSLSCSRFSTLLLFSENNMQEPLVQHQRPVPGIQDHTLDTIGSQRHAEQDAPYP